MPIFVYTLLSTMSMVCVFFLFDAYKQQKKTFSFYAYRFLVLFIIFYLINFFINPRKLEAVNSLHDDAICYFDDEFLYELAEKDRLHTIRLEQLQRQFYQNEMPLNHAKRAEYLQLMHDHYESGKKYYRKAEELAEWYLPSLDEEQAATYCWDAAEIAIGAAVFKASPISTGIYLILKTSFNYSKDCSKQWREMQTCLNQAKYDFEMAEWYCNCVYGHTDVKSKIRKTGRFQ